MVRICERCLNPDVNVLELEVYGARFPNNIEPLGTVVKPRIILTMETQEDADKGIEVDWGDGTKEIIQPTSGSDFQFGEPQQYTGYMTHLFSDGEEKWRTIRFKFLGGIDKLEILYSEWVCYRGELTSSLGRALNLKALYLYSCRGENIEKVNNTNFELEGIESIPQDILRLSKLSSFTANFAWKLGSKLNDKIPLEFFNTSLDSLTYGGGVTESFRDVNINNFDKLPLLKDTLKSFSSNYSHLTVDSFPDNWGSNDIEFVSMLGFSGIGAELTFLSVLLRLKSFRLQSHSIGNPNKDGEWLNIPVGSLLEGFTLWTFSGSGLNNPSKLPTNLQNATKLKYITFGHRTTAICLLSTTEQVTQWWSSWYPFIVANASMDEYAPDQKFRGITFDFRGGVVDTPVVAPTGYQKGVSNGTPITLGEQIYVLSDQYGHTNTYTY